MEQNARDLNFDSNRHLAYVTSTPRMIVMTVQALYMIVWLRFARVHVGVRTYFFYSYSHRAYGDVIALWEDTFM